MKKKSLLLAFILFPATAWGADTSSMSSPFVQNMFNPEISAILDFSYVNVNLNDKSAGMLSVPGYLGTSDRTGKQNGFDFNYLELALGATVDPYFDMFAVLHFTLDGVGIEEAYVDTRFIPAGFSLRGGQFLSAFGRINGQHAHVWEFYDIPLVYEAFIGTDGLSNPGLRVTWTAPIPIFLQANFEVLQGKSPGSPTFDISGYEIKTAAGDVISAKDASVPGLLTGSLKASFDLGNSVFLLGGSAMYGHSTVLNMPDVAGDSVFTGNGTWLYNAELTYKYLINSYESIVWQSEYMGRVMSGRLTLVGDGSHRRLDKNQMGLYSQLVWKFSWHGTWGVGARYDLLFHNDVNLDGIPLNEEPLLPRYTAVLEFSPTEFARIRLQYAYDQSRFCDGVRRDVQEILVQATFAVGPHAAHSF